MKKLILLTIATAVLAGCPKKKPDQGALDGGAGAGAQDTNIKSEPLSFDVSGSDSGKITGLYTINFDFDKSTLTNEGRDRAQKNVDWMKANPTAGLQIEGHCDRMGSIEYNVALGERRAKAVKAYMVNLGADGKKLSIISYGKEKLLDPAETEMADGKNRRANFVIQK